MKKIFNVFFMAVIVVTIVFFAAACINDPLDTQTPLPEPAVERVSLNGNENTNTYINFTNNILIFRKTQ